MWALYDDDDDEKKERKKVELRQVLIFDGYIVNKPVSYVRDCECGVYEI